MSSEKPTLDNLWNYLSHFYERLPPALREQFSFEDAAGIYTEEGRSRLFAICTQYQQVEGLKTLPAGLAGLLVLALAFSAEFSRQHFYPYPAYSVGTESGAQ